jgi:hypothetical protein
LIRDQWQLLLDGNLKDKCERQFTRQYLLPCAHDLKPYYFTRQRLPIGLVHPRWWIEGHVHVDKDWRPQPFHHSDDDEVEDSATAIAAPPPRNEVTVEDRIDAAMTRAFSQRDQLQGESQRRYDARLLEILTSTTEYGQNQQRVDALPLDMPDARPRAQITRAIPTASQAIAHRAQIAAKDAAAAVRKERQDGAQAQLIATYQPPTVVSQPPLVDDGDDEPPPSTAPPRLEDEGRGKRKRNNTVYQVAMQQLKKR